jgi:hypothetical protein
MGKMSEKSKSLLYKKIFKNILTNMVNDDIIIFTTMVNRRETDRNGFRKVTKLR